MATITGVAERSTGNSFDAPYARLVSPRGLPADTVELELDGTFRHVSIGVKMYDGAEEPVVAATGTFAVKYKTLCTGQWETPGSSSITGATPVTLGWSENTEAVQVVPTSLTGVTSWEVVVIQNRS